MKVTLPPLASLLATAGYLGGIAGVILGALGTGGLPPNVRTTVTAIAGILVAIGHFHVTAQAVSSFRNVTPVTMAPKAPSEAPVTTGEHHDQQASSDHQG